MWPNLYGAVGPLIQSNSTCLTEEGQGLPVAQEMFFVCVPCCCRSTILTGVEHLLTSTWVQAQQT